MMVFEDQARILHTVPEEVDTDHVGYDPKFREDAVAAGRIREERVQRGRGGRGRGRGRK